MDLASIGEHDGLPGSPGSLCHGGTLTQAPQPVKQSFSDGSFHWGVHSGSGCLELGRCTAHPPASRYNPKTLAII
jgi:hypothetical protein